VNQAERLEAARDECIDAIESALIYLDRAYGCLEFLWDQGVDNKQAHLLDQVIDDLNNLQGKL
jgi:hypothetical protein